MKRDRGYAWVILIFLWMLGFAAAISRFVMSYYQHEMARDLSVDLTFISFTWSVNIAVAAVCSPLGGWLTDRYGPKKMMLLNALFGVMSMLTVLTFRLPAGFFLGLGLLSGLSGMAASTGYVVVTSWFSRHKAKALMIMTSASSLGLAVLTPLFVSNRDWLDWTTAFTFTLWITLVSIPLTLLIMKERKREEHEADPSAAESPPTAGRPRILPIAKEMVTSRTVLLVVFALFTCGFSMGTVEMHLMAIHRHHQISSVMFTSSLSILGLLELTGGLLFAFLLDRMSRSLALSFLYVFRIVAFTVLYLHFSASPILFSVIFGASYLGAIPGGILVAGEAMGHRSVGLQAGTLLIFHQAGAVLGSFSGGFLYDLTNSYQALIGINLIFSALSATGYYQIHRASNRRRSVPGQPGGASLKKSL
ncbi:MAG: MFS transporter [Paenibacillus lautus]|jgi:MFS family permease|uniref:MFS transporter n=1 Tax=Paenibacillus lautus TaxID=1401 RepID=UPI0026EA278D|nr:MFS transporter [Paenibacillus lautus]MCI1773040.1 MFS transporter [Paenibacillus lautus]